MKTKEPHFSPEDLVIRLKKLIKIVEQVQSDVMGREVTRAQARIIFPIIRDGQGYTIQELSEMGGVTKGLVSRTIACLERKGYVGRDKISKTQDRNYKIVLTPKGQEFVDQKHIKIQKISSKWKELITFEEMVVFKKVLDIVTDAKSEK